VAKITTKESDIFHTIEEEVIKQFKLDVHSWHGIKHWERVEKIGLRLAETTKADIRVISLFSLLHDSKREDEDYDPEHGSRATLFIQELRQDDSLDISEKQLDQLCFACTHHSRGNAQSNDITVQTCWDADRLDLYRLGIMSDDKFLYTEASKQENIKNFAEGLSQY
jgi:uncharacterized protein